MIFDADAEPEGGEVRRLRSSVFLDGETATAGEGDEAEEERAEAGMEKPTMDEVGREFLDELEASAEAAGRSNEAHDFFTAGAAGVGAGAEEGAGSDVAAASASA